MYSTNTVLIEKNSRASGPTLFKPVIQGSAVYIWLTDWLTDLQCPFVYAESCTSEEPVVLGHFPFIVNSCVDASAGQGIASGANETERNDKWLFSKDLTV